MSQKCSEGLKEVCSMKVKVRSMLLENDPLFLMEPRSGYTYLLPVPGVVSQMLIFIALKRARCLS